MKYHVKTCAGSYLWVSALCCSTRLQPCDAGGTANTCAECSRRGSHVIRDAFLIHRFSDSCCLSSRPSQPPTAICLWGNARFRAPTPPRSRGDDDAGAHMPHDITRPRAVRNWPTTCNASGRKTKPELPDCCACSWLIAGKKWTAWLVPRASHVSSLEPQLTADADSICLWLKPRGVGHCLAPSSGTRHGDAILLLRLVFIIPWQSCNCILQASRCIVILYQHAVRQSACLMS